jgi:hypothetical protein
VLSDTTRRDQLVAAGRRRLADFTPDRLRTGFEEALRLAMA